MLELAIGTGRIALPLAARGVRVDGVDFSAAMLAKLRAKPGGEALAVTLGDFADVPVPGKYPLVYIVFNTLFNLLDQDEQVRCFQNVANDLTEEGLRRGGVRTQFSGEAARRPVRGRRADRRRVRAARCRSA